MLSLEHNQVSDWMTTQLEWKGRTDKNLIDIFLRACDFDVELTKKTLSIYYENRINIREWWTDRNLDNPHLIEALNLGIATLLSDEHPEQPSVLIIKVSRIGSRRDLLDPFHKLCTVYADVLMRRTSCQLNGAICIIDCRDYPWWPLFRVLSELTYAKRFINSFYLGVPIKAKKIIALNAPRAGSAFFELMKPFLTRSLIDSIHVLGSDWSSLPDLVPNILLPKEYGGKAGPMSYHEDACVNEVMAHSQIFAED